jgi:hypothetical protein
MAVRERGEVAQLVETVILSSGPRTRRIHPEKQGHLALFFRAVKKGFEARAGGRLKLYDSSNRRTADLGMVKDRMTIKIMGKTVVELYKDRQVVPVLEVKDYLILHGSCGPRYLSLTPSGKLSVRMTPPPKE